MSRMSGRAPRRPGGDALSRRTTARTGRAAIPHRLRLPFRRRTATLDRRAPDPGHDRRRVHRRRHRDERLLLLRRHPARFFLAWLLAFILSPIVAGIVRLRPAPAAGRRRRPRVRLALHGAGRPRRRHRPGPGRRRSPSSSPTSRDSAEPAGDPRPAAGPGWTSSASARSTWGPGGGHPGTSTTIAGAARRAAPVDRRGQPGRDRDHPDRGHPVGLHGGRPGADPGVPHPARAAGVCRRGPAARDVGRRARSAASCAARR